MRTKPPLHCSYRTSSSDSSHMGGGFDVQLLHFTCCLALRCFTGAAAAVEDEREEVPVRRPSKIDSKETREKLSEGFSRKVLGLLVAQLLAWAVASEAFCSLPPRDQRFWAKAGAMGICGGALLLCLRPKQRWRHPLDLVGLLLLGVAQAAVMAPAISKCSGEASLMAAGATIFFCWTVLGLSVSTSMDVMGREGQAWAGMLLFHPWFVMVLLMALSKAPVTPMVKLVFDVLSLIAVAFCGLTDLQRVLLGACTKRGFSMDSTALAAAVLCHSVLHIFLKASCWTLSAKRHKHLL